MVFTGKNRTLSDLMILVDFVKSSRTSEYGGGGSMVLLRGLNLSWCVSTSAWFSDREIVCTSVRMVMSYPPLFFLK